MNAEQITIENLINNAAVIRSDRKSVSAQVKDGKLIIRAPKRMPAWEIRRFIASRAQDIMRLAMRDEAARAGAGEPLSDEEKTGLYRRAREFFPERVAYYAGLLGVSFGRITIRLQKTRWGSCSAKKNLNFNAALMLAPEYVADSVAAHEVCHLIEMNHSEKFYRLLYGVFSEYDAARTWLKTN
ncbi:MAG: M48 family metallopeptidase, partial [Clostridia bacterium]|nr:M48 family metallopeptidase [Clostridia bacterium]